MDQRQIGEYTLAAEGQTGASRTPDLDRSMLLNILSKRFNEEELKILCFDLKVPYDNLGGQGISSKAMELIAFLERRNRIGDIVPEGKRQRPDIPWDDLYRNADNVPRTPQRLSPEPSFSQQVQPIRQNPYIQRGPISDLSRFFGRSAETTEALRCLGDLQSVSSLSIVGPRQVGKTSMLHHIKQDEVLKRHGYDPGQFVFVFISCELLGNYSEGDVFKQVLSEAQRSVSRAGQRADLVRSVAAPVADFNAFRTALAPIREAGLKVIFLFDEFEYLCKDQEFAFTFSAQLALMAPELCVSYVTVTRCELFELGDHKWELAPSFRGLFNRLPVGLFDDQSALALIKEPSSAAGVIFSDKTEDFILGMADHHPLFLQSACFWAFERHQLKQGTLGDEDHQWLRNKVVDCVTQDLTSAWEKLTSEQLQAVSRLDIAQDDPKQAKIIRSLHEQGVISKKDNRFRLCALWADFLKSKETEPRSPEPAAPTVSSSKTELSRAPEGLPFKLQITRQSGSEFEVRALETPMMGEPHAVSHLPYEGAELAAVLEILESRSSDVDLTPGQIEALERLGLWSNSCLASNWLERIGQGLYKALFPDDVRGAVTFAFNQAKSERKRIFSQLRFDEDAADLACYPWELVHDGRRYLCSGGAMEMVRYVTYPEVVTPLRATPPWRLLYIAPRPRDLSALPPEGERLAVWNGLQSLVATGKLTLEQLTAPTYDAFLERMDAADYDILHFDGHGVFARRCAQCKTLNPAPVAVCRNCRSSLDEVQALGYLAFEDDSGDVDFVSTVEMENLLYTKDVRLAFLSACQTAVVGGGSLFGGLGPGLIRAGVPAVVAMQFSVPVDSAIRFAQSFYQALAQGETVARAVAEGRRRLFRDDTWYIPALYLRSQDDEGTLFGA